MRKIDNYLKGAENTNDILSINGHKPYAQATKFNISLIYFREANVLCFNMILMPNFGLLPKMRLDVEAQYISDVLKK